MPSIDWVSKYSNGFKGCPIDVGHRNAFMATIPMPLYGAAPRGIDGSGKGKVALPYKYCQKFDPEFGEYERQEEGDCQNPTDLVRMSDGSTKEIQHIQIGDSVISAFGNNCTVTDIIKKPYSGKMVKIIVDGYQTSISSTPDHLYLVKNTDSNFEWKPAITLTENDHVLLSSINIEENNQIFDMANFCPVKYVDGNSDFKKLRLEPCPKGKIRAKFCKTPINKLIPMSEKLAWLVGLYAAEGGCDGKGPKNKHNRRITYNLCSDEMLFAEQIKQYFKEIFDIYAKISKVPSKPNVLYVRIDNLIICSFFKYLCGGNTYTKHLGKEWFVTNKANKLALIRGWFDGDGHKTKYNSSAVSVSKQLADDFFTIINSCGLSAKIHKKNAYKRTKENYTCYLDSIATKTLYKIENKSKYRIKLENKYITKYGRAAKIKSIEIVDPDTEFVYCIEVENDHSFICNGYGIHNCTSHGARNAGTISYTSDIIQRKQPELYLGRLATEAIYGYRGHSDEGMSPSRAAQFVSKVSGIHLRQKYGQYDLSRYNSKLGHSWGRSGPPKEIIDSGKLHPIETVTLLRKIDEVRDLIYNGYGVTIASSFGFSSKRDNNGISQRSGSWNHQMSVVGMDDSHDRYKDILFCIQNSWGIWNGGPLVLGQPKGSFWIYGEILQAMIEDGEAWGFSGVEGFPSKDLDWSEFDDIF